VPSSKQLANKNMATQFSSTNAETKKCERRKRRRKQTTIMTSSLCLAAILIFVPRASEAFLPSSQGSSPAANIKRIMNHSVAHISLVAKTRLYLHSPKEDKKSSLVQPQQSENAIVVPSSSVIMSRRSALLTSTTAAATVALLFPLTVSAATANMPTSTTKSLEKLALGNGMWEKLRDYHSTSSTTTTNPQDCTIPAYFATYAARFLIHYDEGIASWWTSQAQAVSLLSEQDQESKLSTSFASLARSIQIALESYVDNSNNNNPSMLIQSRQEAYTEILYMFLDAYANKNDNSSDQEIRRQIGILFSMLPASDQPSYQVMNQLFVIEPSANAAPEKPIIDKFVTRMDSFEPNNPPPTKLSQNLAALLPEEYRVVSMKDSNAHGIYPTITLYQVGMDEEFGQIAVGTPFGPLSFQPLIRERPDYTPWIYGLFGISGATGCALTHSIVIPLDVVKTRAQTDPEGSSTNLLQSAGNIIKTEGIQGLLLGAQATLAGYFWYGLSVYPSYTFFKRWFTQTVFPPEFSMVHVNDIALAAGACAAVIASLGLTPLEAARIRVVAEPDTYRGIGLTGTLATIAQEDEELGWKGLYAGLPSLLTRQVIFGSIKFLAFERASEAIFAAAPSLRDATWTALCVSLVAGGMSGAISSIVSQPADSVLTYVAQNNRGSSSMCIIEGCKVMVEEGGVGSLFRGLSSRCVWAAAIIAGQFLLYDVFRTVFRVSSEDLSQVYHVVLPALQS